MHKSTNKTIYQGPVDNSTIHASGNSTVATGGSQINQQGKSIDQSKIVINVGDAILALDELRSFLPAAEGLSEHEVRFGNMLLDNIKAELSKDAPQKPALAENINSIANLIDSATNISSSIKNAITLITSLV
jgi:hypothetical protein